MVNIASGLLGRFIPKNANLTEEERGAIARQGLLSLGAGLLGSQSGGNFGAALSDGIRSGLLSMNKGADDVSDQAYKRAMIANQTAGGTGMQEFGMLTKGLNEEDRDNARRIKLGLAPRAVTGAAKIQDVVGADNVTRPGIFDPMTQTLRVFDGQNWVPAGAGNIPAQAAPTGEQRMTAADGSQVSIGTDIPPQLRAAILANPNADSYGGQQAPMPTQAPMPQANPGLFTSAPKQVTAGQVAAAEANARNASDLAYLQPTLGLQTNAAIQRAGGEAAATAAVKSQADQATAQRDKDSAFRVYDAAVKGLTSGLDGTSTNPLVGRLPAVTASQQTAQGSVAAMAPVLKQLFRASGEGTFTDSDQKLLMDMLPTRMDLPAARKAKLANIDAIVKAKLGAASGGAPAAAPGGPRRLKYNPATGKLE